MKQLDHETILKAPEANHILSCEDIEKLNNYLIRELEETDEESHLLIEDNLGKTLKQAADLYPDYEYETLMHFITALYGPIYEYEGYEQ